MEIVGNHVNRPDHTYTWSAASSKAPAMELFDQRCSVLSNDNQITKSWVHVQIQLSAFIRLCWRYFET